MDVRPLGLMRAYGAALFISFSVTLVAIPLLPHLDHANIVMLFLLAVVGIAARYGRGPAVLVAVLNVLSFNFVFVPPHFAFAFETWQSILTFVVMLVVGLLVGQLTARFRYQAGIAQSREERACHLYEMARALSGTVSIEQVIATSERCIESSLHVKARLLPADQDGNLPLALASLNPPFVDSHLAQQCFNHNRAIELKSPTPPHPTSLYLPIKGPSFTRGVLVIALQQHSSSVGQRRLLDTFSVLIAIALERVHFARIAQENLVKIEAERERNALLAGFSHDLRTPMTALLGLTETLALELITKQSPYQDLLAAIQEQAMRMGLLVDNLLDMAKLQTGGVQLRKDWQSLEELVGSAVRVLAKLLHEHPLRLALDPDLPLIYCDAVLIERVLVNLLQNAAKYTPSATTIGVTATAEPDWLHVTVWDAGPGLPVSHSLALFEKFTRGHSESSVPGIGLGLSICRAIIEAHGGQIQAQNRSGGGACFIFTLPLETPPSLEFDEESALESS